MQTFIYFKINFIYSLFSRGFFFKENNKHRCCFQTTMIISAVDAAPTVSATYGRKGGKKRELSPSIPGIPWMWPQGNKESGGRREEEECAGGGGGVKRQGKRGEFPKNSFLLHVLSKANKVLRFLCRSCRGGRAASGEQRKNKQPPHSVTCHRDACTRRQNLFKLTGHIIPPMKY